MNTIKTEMLANHLDCELTAEAKVEEHFRCRIDGELDASGRPTVIIAKNVNYEVTELTFFCDNHGCRVQVGDNYEWDT